MIDFKYLDEVEKTKNKGGYKWEEDYDAQSTKYRINVPVHNSGDNILINNEIGKLFLELFSIPI